MLIILLYAVYTCFVKGVFRFFGIFETDYTKSGIGIDAAEALLC